MHSITITTNNDNNNDNNTEKIILPSPPSSPVDQTNTNSRKRALSISFLQNPIPEPTKKCKFNYLEPLLKDTSSPNQCDPQYHRSLLSWACIAQSLEKLKELVRNVHLDINQTSGPNKTTALHEASFIGFDKGIPLLLQHSEININATDHQGQTAVHYAVQRNQVECLKILLSSGARIDIKCQKHNRLPIHTAAKYGFKNCLRLLLSYSTCHANNPTETDMVWSSDSSQAVVEYAVISGNVHQLTLLLDYDANQQYRQSNELVSLAVHWNRLECLRLLLQRECPVGSKCLMMAVQERKIDMVRLLAPLTTTCQLDGENPAFLYAASHGFLDMIPDLFTLSTSKECIQQALFLASSIGLHEKLGFIISSTIKSLLSKK